jgi:lipid-A-disaccharide synthase
MAALRQRRPDVTLFGVGGEAMRQAGLEVLANAEEISVAGLTEVILSLPRLWRILRALKHAAATRRPAVAVLIDLPDFNLRLARRLKRLGIPVVYYISPQIWAWRQRRVREIKELVTQMLVVLPFEQTFYQEHGVRARFVGHPLLDAMPANTNRGQARTDLGLPLTQGPLVALLPGSRKQEVTRHLPDMLKAMQLLRRRFPELHAVIPVASTIPRAVVDAIVRRSSIAASIVDGQADQVLVAADAAVVCSGTATLQAALLSRPMVVVYRVSWLSYQILKRLIRVAHVALVNLIAGRRLVPELLQRDFTPEKVESELAALLGDPVTRVRLNQEYTTIRRQLGGPGAATRVAEVVTSYLPEPPAAKAAEGSTKQSGKLWG